MKILILKPSSLGDVVQALPVLRLLKAHSPASQIYWWISTQLAELLRGDRDLAGLFLFDRRNWASPRGWPSAIRSVRQLRRHNFDCVIDLQGLARSSLLAWFTGGHLTIGVEDWREGAPSLYDVVVPRATPLTHAVDWYLDVLKAMRVPIHWNFEWLPPAAEAARQVQAKWRPSGRRWVLINPGGRWTNKLWPAEYYAELVGRLAHQFKDVGFAILGGRSDIRLGEIIAQAAPERCLDLTGRTSLWEMIEWIRLCQLIVTNDTGPMHIAAALHRPIISIFGPTEPRRTGPYGQIDRAVRIALPCAPCLKPVCRYVKPLECLRGIGASLVADRVSQLLQRE